jgi:hypothetical protein
MLMEGCAYLTCGTIILHDYLDAGKSLRFLPYYRFRFRFARRRLNDNLNEADSVTSYQSAVRNAATPLLRESAMSDCQYRSYAEEIYSEEK